MRGRGRKRRGEERSDLMGGCVCLEIQSSLGKELLSSTQLIREGILCHAISEGARSELA